jgi:hypothetical protein
MVAGTQTKVIEIALDQIAHQWDALEIRRQHPHLRFGSPRLRRLKEGEVHVVASDVGFLLLGSNVRPPANMEVEQLAIAAGRRQSG